MFLVSLFVETKRGRCGARLTGDRWQLPAAFVLEMEGVRGQKKFVVLKLATDFGSLG